VVWSDDFDGPEGSPPRTEFWQHEVGGGWGDAQLQRYVDSTSTASITADGQLAITALREHDGVVSARLITKDRVLVSYGRVEARIKVPTGTGLWPAFWMLGSNIDEVGWPHCGEIDVMEYVSSEPTTVHGTVHGPGFAGVGAGIGHAHDSGVDLAADFHVYAVEWESERITWLLDDVPYFSLEPGGVPDGGWVFQHGFYLLVNLAVGGGWPGNDAAADLPASMLVDWVRVHAPRTDA